MVLLGTIDALAAVGIAFMYTYLKLVLHGLNSEKDPNPQPLASVGNTVLLAIVAVEFLPGIVHWMNSFWNLATGLL